MRIQHNLLAMNSQRNLLMNSNASSKTIEKLSSGLRINKAGDDAAGLAISEKMRSQIRGLNMASRNAQDAISLVQTAEGATSEVHNILQRVRELSVQSANGTNNSEDKSVIQNEVSQLISEIDRIAETTEFNGMKILKGEIIIEEVVEEVAVVAPVSTPIPQATVDILTSKIPAYLDDAMDQIEANFSIDTPVGLRDMNVEYYYDDVSTTGASMGTADGGASLILRVNLAGITDSSGNLKSEEIIDTLLAHEMMHAYQFMNMDFATDGIDTAKEMWFIEGLAMAIQGGNGFSDVNPPAPPHVVDLTNPFDGDYKAAFEAVKTLHEITSGGINSIIDRLEAGDTLDQALNVTNQDFAGELNGAAGAANFTDVTTFINWFNADANGDVTTYLTSSDDFNLAIGSGVIEDGAVQGSHSLKNYADTIFNDSADIKATTSFNITFVNSDIYAVDETVSSSESVEVESYQSIDMQIGANNNQSIAIRLENVTAVNLGIDALDVSDGEGAKAAIDTLDVAIAKVSDIRGRFGAIQNRLEHTIKSLDNSAENLQASESRIRDVDMAKEMITFSKLNILTQAAQSMLAQSNQAPQGVLQLLR